MSISYKICIGLLCIVTLSSAAIKEYVLRPGDIISINVVEHDEFSQKTKIRPDGRINYPLLGEIDVAGLTSSQLVKVMEEKLAPYVNNVVVSVSIEAYFSNKIFIIGAVYRSGEFQIFEPIDAMKALALAGGMKNPNTKNIKLVRSSGEVVTLNLEQFWTKKSAKSKEKFLLYPGDTLYVPERFQIPWGMLATIFSMIHLSVSVYVALR